jgi:hypothetical protein
MASNAMKTTKTSAKQYDEPVVWVRRQWNSGFSALYRLAHVDGVHWDTVSGGVQAPTPQPFMHGYVWCDGMLEGEVEHSCAHGPGPHRIKVCVVKKDNTAAVIAQLLAVAGPKPPRPTRVRHPKVGTK